MFQSISLFGKIIQIYGPLNAIANLSAILLLILHLKEYKSFCTLPRLAERAFFKKDSNSFFKNWFFVCLEAVVLYVLVVLSSTSLTTPLSLLFLGDTSGGYFPVIFFTPIFLFVFCIIFRVAPLKFLDFVAPLGCFVLILLKISCFCEGCCYGVETDVFGMLNHYTDRVEFPIQLVEVACAVIMFVILCVTRKKRKRFGFQFPLFMVMYSGSRFISEFWRADYPGVIGRLTGNHLMCIIGFVLGAIYLFVVLKWGERITAYFETRNKAFLDKQLEKKYIKRVQAKRKKK